jgi:hypothetical protein
LTELPKTKAGPSKKRRIFCAACPDEVSCRMFLCGRCRSQVLICRRCDRGQIYCIGTCAQLARRDRQREARRRYQATPRGRAMHAERSRRYRARQPGVTDHGSSKNSEPGLPPRVDAHAAVNEPSRQESATALVLSSLRAVGVAISTPVNPSPRASPAKNEPQRRIWSPTLTERDKSHRHRSPAAMMHDSLPIPGGRSRICALVRSSSAGKPRILTAANKGQIPSGEPRVGLPGNIASCRFRPEAGGAGACRGE